MILTSGSSKRGCLASAAGWENEVENEDLSLMHAPPRDDGLPKGCRLGMHQGSYGLIFSTGPKCHMLYDHPHIPTLWDLLGSLRVRGLE